MTREPARTEFADAGLVGEGVGEGACERGPGAAVGVRGTGFPLESRRWCHPGDEGDGAGEAGPPTS